MKWRDVRDDEYGYIKKNLIPKDIALVIAILDVDLPIMYFTVQNIKMDMGLFSLEYLFSNFTGLLFYLVITIILLITLKVAFSSIRDIIYICNKRFTVVDCLIDDVYMNNSRGINTSNVTIKLDTEETMDVNYASFLRNKPVEGNKALLVRLGRAWELVV